MYIWKKILLLQIILINVIEIKKRENIDSSTFSLIFHERAGIRTPDNLIKSQVLYRLSYTPLLNYYFMWLTWKCPEPESNQRHEDFQSSALPTELSGHTRFRVSSGGRIWTYDLRVMSPTSFQTAPPRVINLMDGEGFEPSKAVPTDLQSAPFGHSGIHP